MTSYLDSVLNQRVAAGSSDHSVDLTSVVSLFRFDEASESDLFFAFGGLQGVTVTASIDVVNGRFHGTIRYTYSDWYGFGVDDVISPNITIYGRSANAVMRTLQLIGAARPFEDTITVDEPFDEPCGSCDITSTSAMVHPFDTGPTVSNAAGFGTDPGIYYRFYFANGFEVAGKTDASGQLNNLLLPPDASYRAILYAPAINSYTSILGTTGLAGQVFGYAGAPSTLSLDNFGGIDSDGDGIPDVGELAIGTDPNKWSTTGDGISDSAKLAAGLDPLDGRSLPTGIVASLPLGGAADDVVVQGSTAYVATDNAGLAIVDVSNFTHPVLQAQLALPGAATDVAALPELGLVAVATNSGGLQIVDVSNPTQPFVLYSVSMAASRVDVADGDAYVASNDALVKVDMVTGDIIQTLTLGGGSITDIVHDGSMLYTMDTNQVLRAVDISANTMVARGSVTMPVGGQKIFVGGGIVYAAASDFQTNGGYATADVSDPDHLFYVGFTPPPDRRPGTSIALNGSGLRS